VNQGAEKGIVRIVMYPSDDPEELADRFGKEHGLAPEK